MFHSETTGLAVWVVYKPFLSFQKILITNIISRITNYEAASSSLCIRTVCCKIETLKCCQHCYKMMPRKTTVFSYQKQKMKIEVIATYKMKLCKMIFEETFSLFLKYNSSSIGTKIETKSNISHSTTLANSLGKRRVFLQNAS